MLQFSCDKTHCIDLRVCPHCEIQRLKEENHRLREALERISNYHSLSYLHQEVVSIARQALEGGEAE
jgi:hypothetical protein